MKETDKLPAFLYGESVFTTCRIKNGKIQLWNEHLQQLVANGVNYYFLDHSHQKSLKKMILNEVESFQADKDGALRITVFANSRDQLLGSFDFKMLKVSLSFRPQDFKSSKKFKLKTYKRVQDSVLDTFKVGSYGKELYLKRLALDSGFDDILFTGEDKVFEASTSNIFFVKDDKLITPVSGVYQGIIRAKIIQHFNVEERDVLIGEIKNFESAFITNSIQITCPVSQIDHLMFSDFDCSAIKNLCEKDE